MIDHSSSTRPPRLPANVRGGIRPAGDDLREARLMSLEREGSYDSLVVEGQNLPMESSLDWSVASFLDCDLRDLSLGSLMMDHASMTTSAVGSCGVVRLSLAESSVFDCSFSGSRFGSLEAAGSVLRSVLFEGCRIGYLNLREAAWRDVSFRDCRIETFDAIGASLTRIDFPGCTIGSLSLQHAKNTDVDLRQSTIRGIVGAEHLAGTTMGIDQIADLAPAFAASIGIRTQ